MRLWHAFHLNFSDAGETMITCNANSSLPVRFWDHARLGLWPTIQEHKKNVCERIGDIGLWPAENVPRFIRDSLCDPKVITVAMTVLASLANSYAFYPEQTHEHVVAVIKLVENIPFWAVKFGTYICLSTSILACGARAFGRFTNPELMNQFYTEVRILPLIDDISPNSSKDNPSQLTPIPAR